MTRLWTLITAMSACLWAACGGPCDASGLAAGEITAQVDGAAWQGGAATWGMAGSSLQLNSASAGDWWLSAVAQETVDGLDLEAALASLPAEIELAPDGLTGWATFYPASGDSFSTKQASGGLLVLDAVEGGELTGCLSFTAADASGVEVVVREGRFKAVER
jgi:hypothetical protein